VLSDTAPVAPVAKRIRGTAHRPRCIRWPPAAARHRGCRHRHSAAVCGGRAAARIRARQPAQTADPWPAPCGRKTRNRRAAAQRRAVRTRHWRCTATSKSSAERLRAPEHHPPCQLVQQGQRTLGLVGAVGHGDMRTLMPACPAERIQMGRVESIGDHHPRLQPLQQRQDIGVVMDVAAAHGQVMLAQRMMDEFHRRQIPRAVRLARGAEHGVEVQPGLARKAVEDRHPIRWRQVGDQGDSHPRTSIFTLPDALSSLAPCSAGWSLRACSTRQRSQPSKRPHVIAMPCGSSFSAPRASGLASGDSRPRTMTQADSLCLAYMAPVPRARCRAERREILLSMRGGGSTR